MFYGCNLTPRFSPTAAASPDTDDVGRRAGRAGDHGHRYRDDSRGETQMRGRAAVEMLKFHSRISWWVLHSVAIEAVSQ